MLYKENEQSLHMVAPLCCWHHNVFVDISFVLSVFNGQSKTYMKVVLIMSLATTVNRKIDRQTDRHGHSKRELMKTTCCFH